MSRGHARPRAYPAPPGAMPGELVGRANQWNPVHPGAASAESHTTSEHLSVMANPPGWARGWQEHLVIPNPVAGSVWSHQVDGRWSERLVSARWVLTTSAVAANRFPVLYLTDTNGVRVLCVWAGGTVVASTVNGVTLAGENTIQSNYGGIETFGPMPNLIVPPGYTWTATVQNIDVADTLTGIVLIVDRFPSDTTRKYRPVEDGD